MVYLLRSQEIYLLLGIASSCGGGILYNPSKINLKVYGQAGEATIPGGDSNIQNVNTRR